MQKLSVIKFKTSYGSKDTRIDDAPVEFNNNIWCRLAIGYENTYNEIINDLNILLE